ncbi:DUF3413 domain-containing protein [Paraglaciecola sp. 2405UD69-4]|uniref:DUF3413 domain-containing protein n=1 Tax=Paraglaciecola sp. 2405UD69-4 TaxID=3391836 RepID=UPI0039C9EADC
MILAETPRRKLVSQLVTWGHWFALQNIVLAIIIAAIYILNSPAPFTAIGNLYLFTNWVSHIGFLTFFAFVILILPLCYLLSNAKAVKIISSIVSALGLALLAFDALLYNKYGVHLSFNSAVLIRDEAQTVMSDFGWQQWGFLALLFIVWFLFQLVVANALWQRVKRLQKKKLGLPISSFFVACFVISHGLHVWADAKLYQPIVKQDNMFPLSYPATAKTLMSRYSLLDLEDYQQRKALQFDQTISGINYPATPVYCAVQNDQKVLLLGVIDEEINGSIPGISTMSQHYGLQSSLPSSIKTVLYGLPELYHSALSSYEPILLSLPASMGLNISVYSEEKIAPKVDKYTQNWDEFKNNVRQLQSNLAIGFVSTEGLSQLLTTEVQNNYQILITHLGQTDTLPSQLFSNININKKMSSHEDLAPTILNLLGCSANTNAYSTGSDLTSDNKRRYIVSTQGSKVLLLTDKQRIEIMNNGNVRIFDLSTNEEVFTPVDTGLLSQGIKRLSSFSAKSAR